MDNEKYTKAIGKILRDTIDDKIKWWVISKDEVNNDIRPNLTSQIFETEYGGKTLRTYSYKYSPPAVSASMNYYTISNVLEMVDNEGTSYWRFPISGSLVSDLISTINAKINDVDGFLNKILNDET